MTYTTNNLISLLDADDLANAFATVSPIYFRDGADGTNFYNAEGNAIYTVVGNTRYSSNIFFRNELTTDHAYYIHDYL